VYSYNQLQSWGRTRKKVEAEIKWDIGRIDNAFDHLRKLKLIDFKEHNSNIVALPAPGNSHSIRKNIRQTEIILTKEGISTVENLQKFKLTFGLK